MKYLKTLIGTVMAVLLINTASSQSYVQIGSGTQSTSYPPYSVWNYGWFSAIYPQSAVGTAKSITKIAFECINGPKSFSNQKIYMKHTASAIFSSAAYEDPANSGYTLVYDGPVSFNGWTEITLSTPFAYNGTDNLIVHYENRNGSANYANFNSTISTTNNNKSAGSDGSFPTASGYLNPYPGSLPNIRFYYTSTGPATPAVVYPTDNTTKVPVDSLLRFDLGANTTAYDLYFSTDSASVNSMNVAARVVNNATVAAPGTFTWQFPSHLNSKTKYFWMVVAKNGSNTAAAPMTRFTSQRVISNFPFTEGFEDSTVFYPGWYGEFTDWTYPVTAPNGMVWNAMSGNDAHGGTYCAYTSPFAGTTESSLMTPRFYLPSGSTISFWWRNGAHTAKLANQDSTFYEISTNGGASWTRLATLSPSAAQAAYNMEVVNLSAYAGSNVYMRWRYKMNSYSATNYVFLDDINIVTGGVPTIAYDSASLAFNDLAAGSHTHSKIKIVNQGVQNLVITSTSVNPPFSCSYTGTIAPGASDTAEVIFTANTAGSYNATLTFIISGSFTGSNTVNVSGTVYNPLGSFFENFDLSTSMPNRWNVIHSATDANNNASIAAGSSDAWSAPNCFKILNANDSISPLIAVMAGVTNFDVNTLSFYAKAGGAYSEKLVIGLMDDPYDAATFVPVDTIVPAATYAQYNVNFDAANTKPYMAFRHMGPNDWTSFRIDDVDWNTNTPAVPNCATALYPSDAQSSVDVMMDVVLRWAGGGGAPDAFKVYFGTTPNPSTLICDTAATAKKLTLALNYSTTYYWKVIPYNAQGDASGCSEWSFTTMADPTVTPQFCEDFDAVSDTLAVPLGWSFENLAGQAGQTFYGLCWELVANNATYTDNAHSAPNAMTSGPEMYTKNNWLYTPPVALNAGTNYEVSFWYKMRKMFSTDIERMRVVLCSDNKSTSAIDTIWDNNAITSETYEQASVQFQIPADGSYFVAFQSYSPFQYGVAENNVLLIDDICVQESSGIADNELSFGIYPNPNNGSFTIETGNITDKAVRLEVLDILGQIVYTAVSPAGPSIEVNLKGMSEGVYFVRLSTDNKTLTKKVIIR
jgi:hypothetical protein